jgi:hypothetical protein
MLVKQTSAAAAGRRILSHRPTADPGNDRDRSARDCGEDGDAALAAALQRLHAAQRRPGPQQVEALMLPFAPFRSIATFHLWASLKDAA